ncbi:uncharacterized protein PHACADRAFT_248858 [Phanerochaete carnosa HHB-10118-sp]|uniref:Uncharacterized protein n=1 Tax=Phanerochaete carnosa (strain HHB-10118-sp) TaxID=650164 RepID=K5W4D4_PHACS|nr:uncharacterized protein PHACADRAFT_248858 [Phanerochaete carnosa HHB-10118-sp]EKM58773.1 hypothetical protein PHACADRAFT_248858 [Phanerochaete carnosa HHB-10118-sp]
MEDVISHERKRASAHRMITAADLAKWPNATLDGAGLLVDWPVFASPDTRPLKSSQLVFTHPRLRLPRCEHYALSADGVLLAASFNSTDILIWRLPDGLLVQRLLHQGRREHPSSLSFSPNGRALVSGSEGMTAIIWDVQRGCVLRRLTGHSSFVDNATYAPDGVHIATSDLNRSVKIWDALTGACLQSFNLEWHTIRRLTFSPDSSRLCVQVHNSCVIYDTRFHRRVAVLRHNKANSISCSMSRQGDRVITGTYSESCNGVKIWNMVTGHELLTIDSERKLLPPVAFSPDGAEVLAICGADKTALAYDSRTGQLRRTFKPAFISYCVAYSPNGDYVAFGNQQGSLEIYGAKSGTFIGKAEKPRGTDVGDVGAFKFLPDSRTILLHFLNNSSEPLCLYNIQNLVRM